jgi:hypothetical protein
MMERSPLFVKLVEGHAPPCNYKINYHAYTKGTYLAVDVYPRRAAFVKTISKPLGQMKPHFVSRQESSGKISSGHLVYSKLDLLVSGTLLLHGLKFKCRW